MLKQLHLKLALRPALLRLLLVVSVLLLAAAVVSAQDSTYVVQRGDTVQRIADRYGVTAAAIIARNNLTNPNRILVGQTLIIPTGQVSPGPDIQYVVQPGDTLRNIATRYGTTWQALATYNNIPNPNRIHVGMIIRIPTGGVVQPPPAQTITYFVQPGDTLSQIAARYGTTVHAILSLNNLSSSQIFPGQRLHIQPGYIPPFPPSRPGNVYTVRAGDTMLRIAQAFGVNVWRLAEANRIYNLNRILTGQRLVVP